ncbi:MAG: alcohol dehydrogenase [Planctomycetaceae bacterium]|nr:alcohol dehydrogenase [Planctomycetaceae bacterium]
MIAFGGEHCAVVWPNGDSQGSDKIAAMAKILMCWMRAERTEKKQRVVPVDNQYGRTSYSLDSLFVVVISMERFKEAPISSLTAESRIEGHVPRTENEGIMSQIDAWVATGAKQKLVRQSIDLGPLGEEEVEVQVEHCRLCHSDLSILNNEWGFSQFPAVLGHEIVERVIEVGPAAKGLKVGQRVGIGWTAASCMHCRQCKSGHQNLCAQSTFTIVGHKGGFASHVRARWIWTIPLSDNANFGEAGPLFCGGITVFNPLMMYATPTSRVGIIGIGGLGHMAVKFARAYGCDVTAFTSSANKFDEARGFARHHARSRCRSSFATRLAV